MVADAVAVREVQEDALVVSGEKRFEREIAEGRNRMLQWAEVLP